MKTHKTPEAADASKACGRCGTNLQHFTTVRGLYSLGQRFVAVCADCRPALEESPGSMRLDAPRIKFRDESAILERLTVDNEGAQEVLDQWMGEGALIPLPVLELGTDEGEREAHNILLDHYRVLRPLPTFERLASLATTLMWLNGLEEIVRRRYGSEVLTTLFTTRDLLQGALETYAAHIQRGVTDKSPEPLTLH